MSGSGALFACTRCNSRHPFEDLSSGQQLCKDCRGAFHTVKCTYCRTEFQQESKSNINTICKKCEHNVKLYGKPTACEYCNIIAAFIGNKCQRCTNSEKKFGPPLSCDQCKQRCAFDRKDPESRKKVDGKLLCWLCTLSYKRALAKAKQNDTSIRHTSISVHKSHHRSSTSSNRSKADHHALRRSHHSGGSNNSTTKKPRLDLVNKTANGSLTLPASSSSTTNTTDTTLMDHNNSDHVVAVAQLKEQIAIYKKELQRKDQELLNKDKKFAELKSKAALETKELREKVQAIQRESADKLEDFHKKIAQLQKINASLMKANKKNLTPNDSPSIL